MFASLVLAAALLGQTPPSGGIRQQPPPVLVYFPGYTDKEKAVFRDYGPPSLGPKAGRFDDPYPFRVVYPGPDTPAGFYFLFSARPWYFIPPSGAGIR